ncbi:hypothetical protein RJ641_022751 [Dillenia turbinata]|uniref:Protease Do-like PDZ domain-containing protein n=1 Tax=Dillenia turbinata TaxID=194707 RepID=A0AAN8UD10_9MAGN
MEDQNNNIDSSNNKRKRGRKPEKNKEPSSIDATDPISKSSRRGRGRPPKIKNPIPKSIPSPERRNSRYSGHNGDYTVSVNGTNVVAEVPPPVPKWESVVKVVPAMDAVVKVKLKKRGSDSKNLATVLAIGTECDIEFLLGNLGICLLQDAVTIVGYPIGGDTISVTSGVVSRMEILSYVHGSTELLGLQLTVLLYPEMYRCSHKLWTGNSGGPAFNDKGKCVGIAFQSLKHEDVVNIGFPIIGVEWQKMENPDLGMGPHQKGVRIRRIEPTAPESHVLKPPDIILSFDGVNIANDGTVPFRHGERIGFSYLVSQKYTGDKALVKYGKEYEFDAPVKLLDKHLHAMAQSIDEQLVVVSQEDIVNTQVLAFNGKPVKNLKSLAHMVESCTDEFLKFDLEYRQIVVLQTATCKAATLDILTTHCLPSAVSDDRKT